MKRIVFITLLTILTGCSISHLQHSGLKNPVQLQSGDVYIRPLATGFTGGKVGNSRLSIFYIPINPVRIKSNEAKDLMDVVTDALMVSGYNVFETNDPGASPVLKAHVNEVKFNNYTWTAPIIPSFGKFDVTLTLESKEGFILWKKGFKSSGTSFNFFNGYNTAATRAVTKLANQMVDSFSRPNFYLSLKKEVSQIPYNNKSKKINLTESYIGEKKNGFKEGLGTYSHPSGTKYVGEWKDDYEHGQGTKTYLDGGEYVGEWMQGQKYGLGTYTYPSGSIYFGNWKDNKRNGQGTFVFVNGDKYVGDFKDGHRHGKGVYEASNGDKYVGEWNQGKQHGQGTKTHANGSVEKGTFANGEPQNTKKIFPPKILHH